MSVTIRDIAREAGVSVASVSKVLHGGGENIRVSEARAVEIRAVAERLNYVPNSLARSLRSGRSQTVGVVFENFGSISAGPMYYVYMFDGIAQVLFKRHYRLTILPEIDVKNVASMLTDGRLDGVIWCKLDREGQLADALREVQIPIVAMNAPFGSDLGIPCFSCDNLTGSRLVVDHLVSLGHRRVLFVTEKKELQTPDSRARHDSFRTAMRARGLRAEEAEFEAWHRDAREFEAWWASDPDYTAIYAWNEGLAGDILLRARECGVSIPTDLSVVGYDSTAFCDTTSPSLTAVRQPIKEMAEAATKALFRMMAGNAALGPTPVFPCTLDVRRSTAKPRTPRV